MKQHMIRTNDYMKPRARIVATLLLMVVAAMSLPAFGQNAASNLDAAHSTARLFVGSRNDPYSFRPGVARVSGKMLLNGDDPGKTVLNLSIYPGASTKSDDSVRMSFQSKKAVRMADGELAVTGDLTLTQVTRSVTIDANEAYAGPVYGDPIEESTRREVTFVFPASQAQKGSTSSIAATATVGRENFPQLLPAIMEANWPVVVEDEECQVPSSVGEGYAGPICTGNVIATANRTVPASYAGEGYHGVEVVPPAGNQITIQLDLAAVRPGASAEVGGN